jgi:hypothetical protein
MLVLLVVAEYKGEYGDCWPLLPEMEAVIENSYGPTAELLRVDDKLIEAVVSEGCFKKEQLENVTGTPFEKSKKLLDKFTRSDINNLNRFVRCLRVMRPEVVLLLTRQAGKDFKQQMLLSACDEFSVHFSLNPFKTNKPQ